MNGKMDSNIIFLIAYTSVILPVIFLGVIFSIGAHQDDECPECKSHDKIKKNLSPWKLGDNVYDYDLCCANCGRKLESTFGELSYREIKEWEDAESK